MYRFFLANPSILTLLKINTNHQHMALMLRWAVCMDLCISVCEDRMPCSGMVWQCRSMVPTGVDDPLLQSHGNQAEWPTTAGLSSPERER